MCQQNFEDIVLRYTVAKLKYQLTEILEVQWKTSFVNNFNLDSERTEESIYNKVFFVMVFLETTFWAVEMFPFLYMIPQRSAPDGTMVEAFFFFEILIIF